MINEIKENSKNQNNTKDLNYDSINKYNLYKPPFSLDKIKKFIYNRKKFQELIKSENSDERLLKLQKILKKKLCKINPESPRLIKKNDLLSKIMKKKNNTSEIVSIKSISNKLSRNKNIILEKYNSEYNLPKLNIFKLIKRPEVEEKTTITLFHNINNNNNVNIKKRDDYFIQSDLITGKDLFQNQSRIIKISSFSNKSNNNEIIDENKKILDINEINNKFNLKLNLGKNKNKESKIFNGKKYTIFGMLNKLFQYYSSEKNNNINTEKNNQDNNYINYPIFNNSELINWNEATDKINLFSKKNTNRRNSSNVINSYNSSDSSNLYITKLNVTKKPLFRRNSHLNISQLIKERCSISEMRRKNKEIIDNNRKVSIDCLFSKYEEKINIKKIFYKYLGKSIYEYEKDPSYTRIKVFDKKINKLLKKNLSF